MTTILQVVLIGGMIAAAYGTFAAVLTIRAIWKGRTEAYRAQYEEFLLQRARVRGKIKGVNENGE